MNKKLLLSKEEKNNKFDFLVEDTSSPYETFLSYYPNIRTRESVLDRLIAFLDFVGIDKNLELDQRYSKFVQNAKNDNEWCKEQLSKYFQYLENRLNNKEIRKGTAHNCKTVVKKVMEQIGMNIDWKRINKIFGTPLTYANDVAYSIEQINRLCEYGDPRMKALVYVMATSGIRLGAWASINSHGEWTGLRKKHIVPYKDENGKILCAYLKVYDGEPNDEYWTLITKEAYDEILKWFKIREKAGEVLNDESPVMCKLWNLEKKDGAKIVKPITDEGISSLFRRAIKRQGLRPISEKGKSARHDVKMIHGLRKFHSTALRMVRNPEIRNDDINILTGHKGVGYTDNYYRASNNPEHRIGSHLIKDYLRAEEFLTIDPRNKKLDKMKEEITKELESKYKNQMNQLIETMNQQYTDIMKMIQQNPKLAKIKPEALKNKKIGYVDT